jgi:hypothetical protein
VTISRYRSERDEVHTLINVGDLAPWEVRRPTAEIYRLGEFPDLKRLLLQGVPHRAVPRRPGHGAQRRAPAAPARQGVRGRGADLYAGEPWGELYVTRHIGHPRFSDPEIAFLQAITGQIAAAIGRGEVFGRLAELAFEDPLTGLANRRALDERLEAAVAARPRGRGPRADRVRPRQPQDDQRPRRARRRRRRAVVAAEALAAAAARRPGSLVARLGGDEFCVLLPGCDAQDAREVAAGRSPRSPAATVPRSP